MSLHQQLEPNWRHSRLAFGALTCQGNDPPRDGANRHDEREVTLLYWPEEEGIIELGSCDQRYDARIAEPNGACN